MRSPAPLGRRPVRKGIKMTDTYKEEVEMAQAEADELLEAIREAEIGSLHPTVIVDLLRSKANEIEKKHQQAAGFWGGFVRSEDAWW